MRQKITFHVIRVKVSSKSRCLRTLPMNVAIESAHCGCERNSCIERERERERERVQLVRLPNGDNVVMGSTPTFHNGI